MDFQRAISISSGNASLDDILMGGFTPNRMYLVEGTPGSGKTTLALQYLMEGASRGESGLYVTLSETKKELYAVAESHGWSLDGINVFELIPAEEALAPESQYTMFHPSEVELSETTKAVLKEVEATKPVRIVFDSLSEMRLLAQSPLRYRRQILALKHFFTGRQCTVLLLDDQTAEPSDLQLQSIAHGVICLEQLALEFGAERRRLRVVKMRGQKYRGGYHDFAIKRGGLEIYPRLVAAEHHTEFSNNLVSSGLAPLDTLVGGGLHRGTSTLFIGPAGSGKSSIAVQYACAAAARGEKSVLFAFDESTNTLLTRADGLGLNLRDYFEKGTIVVQRIDPAEMSPGEFAGIVRQAVDKNDVKIVVIDSLNGYLNAMPQERFLTIQMHELLTYLGHKGVNTLLVVAQTGLVGTMTASVDISYLADAVILFRYFEAGGEVRLAMSVMKNRSGKHERSIREIKMNHNGIEIGSPLHNFSGILSVLPLKMDELNDTPNSDRILVLAPTPRDTALCQTILNEAGMGTVAITSITQLCAEINIGAAAVMVTEESVDADQNQELAMTLKQQPAWSDLPVLVMTKGGADSATAAQALEWLGNVILLERPVRINTLVSAARVALRARHRQYQIKNHLLRHETAEAELREKGEMLMEQTERLFRSNQELEQFAYVSSHDLQEPLRKLSTFAHMLSDKYESLLDADGKRYLSIIINGATRMTSLIRDLLAYARFGKEHTVEAVDLKTVVTHVLNDLDMLMQEKQAVVCVGDLPSVFANSTHLHHVFLNLLSNAIKFQSTQTPRIEIKATETNGFVQVSVSDNGIGIEPKYAQQIFQVFQRLHAKSKYEGNGIGLAICKKIVEQHKGKIWVESNMGAGATFHFTLPMSKHHNWDIPNATRKVEANAGLN